MDHWMILAGRSTVRGVRILGQCVCAVLIASSPLGMSTPHLEKSAPHGQDFLASSTSSHSHVPRDAPDDVLCSPRRTRSRGVRRLPRARAPPAAGGGGRARGARRHTSRRRTTRREDGRRRSEVDAGGAGARECAARAALGVGPWLPFSLGRLALTRMLCSGRPCSTSSRPIFLGVRATSHRTSTKLTTVYSVQRAVCTLHRRLRPRRHPLLLCAFRPSVHNAPTHLNCV
jgi:hypothetical protein